MDYNFQNAGKKTEELWQEKTVHVLSGGFNIVGFAQFAALGYLPKGIPINIDFATRNATPIKGAVLNADLAANATTAQVKKGVIGRLFYPGDFIGNSAKAVSIVGVNTDNAAYDVITLSEAIGAVSAGGVLFSATEAGVDKVLSATALVYADVKYKATKSHCSAIIQAYEVQNKKLPYPLTQTQKTQLTSRIQVVG